MTATIDNILNISSNLSHLKDESKIGAAIASDCTHFKNVLNCLLPGGWVPVSITKLLTTKLKGSVKEPNMFHNYETEKITRKARDVAENLQLYRVVWFFRPRSSCRTHLMLFTKRPPIYASCIMISGGRTDQHIIIGFGELAAVN